MQIKDPIDWTRSPAPGIIPEPTVVHEDDGAGPRLSASAPMTGQPASASSPGWRRPASAQLTRLRSALRGDKYMVNAYPPRWHGPVAPKPGADQSAAIGTEER
jgi:hypothetical protein